MPTQPKRRAIGRSRTADGSAHPAGQQLVPKPTNARHTRLNFKALAAQTTKHWTYRPAGLAMGAWGIGLYSGDFARDLKATISAVCRLPLDEEALVEAICQSASSAATNPADEDHTIFWLVLADQFEKRGIFSRRVREMALAIINDRKDAAAMQALGMKPADTRKRAGKLAELRARLLAQPEFSRPRKTITEPEPYVFQLFGVYAYPTSGGKLI